MSYLSCVNSCNKLPGAWRMVSLEEFGRGLDVALSPNNYWISSNQVAMSGGMLLSAKRSSEIAYISLSEGDGLKECMCYIRAQATMVQTMSANSEESLSNVVSNLDSIFQQVEGLEASLASVEEQLFALDSIGSIASPDTSVHLSLGQATLSCIDFGLHSQCSPQGGYCDNVSNDPTSDGRYPVTSSCQSNYDPNQCVSPNWRRFRVEADGIGQLSHLNILFVQDGYSGSNPNTYPSKFGQSSIPFEVISDDAIEFFAGSDLGESGLTGFGVDSSNNASWSQVHHPMSVVIQGRHYFLPFGLRF